MNETLNSSQKRFIALLALSLLALVLAIILSSSPVQGKGTEAVANPVQSGKLQAAAGDGAINNIGQAVGQLRADTNGVAEVTYSRSTPAVSYVGLKGALSLTEGSSAVSEAMAFFNAYGGVFGITNAANELAYTGALVDNAGNTHLTFQQAYNGVPVFAGVLRVHLNADNAINSITGVFVPGLAVSNVASITAADANAIALAKVGETKDVSDASAAATNLVVFRTGLVQGIYGTNHLAYGVEVTDGMFVREFVYLDAHDGRVLDTYTGIHDAKDRETWDAMGAPAPGGSICRDEGDGPIGDVACDEAHDYAGDTYDYFDLGFGRDSLDDMGMQMLSYVDVCPSGCPWINASWNGLFMSYGTSPTGRPFTSDDTVAHEFGHGVTQFTSNLIYAWQPGAINEAISDVYGETVDVINGAGLDSPESARADYAINSTGTYPGAAHCVAPFGWDENNTYTNVRWLQGEQDYLIRDMWAPSCMGDPDHVSHTNYHCSTTDQGGVHTNSGVVNHHYALLVDGGTFNGETIGGIGLTKAGAIYYQAQTMYLGPTSNFADLEIALNQACTDLVGTTPNDPSTGNPSASAITAGDCTDVAATSTAVELSLDPAGQCGFTTLLDPNTPALCQGGGTAASVLFEDWESGTIGTWITGTRNVANPSTYDTPPWDVVGSLPNSRPGSALFVPDILVGDCAGDTEAGVQYIQSPPIVVPNNPASTGTAGMTFDHWVATEATWDGGNIKISVNGGGWTLVPSSSFDFNAYNSALASVGAGNDNPMAGEAAFTGTDGGSVGGSWGQSQINLAGLANPGDSVEFRIEFGTDGCNGIIGWYVDEVNVYACATPTDVSLTGFGEEPTTATPYTALWLVVVLVAAVGLGFVVRRRVSVENH